MVGMETSQIMHPQVWKVSGHYDLFHDMMVDCKECKSRFRADHLKIATATVEEKLVKCETYATGLEEGGLSKTKQASLNKAGKDVEIAHHELPPVFETDHAGFALRNSNRNVRFAAVNSPIRASST